MCIGTWCGFFVMLGKYIFSEHFYLNNILYIIYFGFIISLIAIILDQFINILMDLSTVLQNKIKDGSETTKTKM